MEESPEFKISVTKQAKLEEPQAADKTGSLGLP